VKRFFDVISSFIAIIILAPVLITVALFVRIKLGSPVVFVQRRPGLHGKPFNMLKFRTMTDDRDSKGALLSDQERMTPFGRMLRSTSLDELPGLFSILKGDMSVVGPRPLLMEYLPLYSDRQSRRHDVQPGLTGWAQVNGRNAIPWEEKFELDVWYVERRCFFLDMKIIALTLIKVFKKSGISHDGEVTMHKFTGSITNQEVDDK